MGGEEYECFTYEYEIANLNIIKYLTTPPRHTSLFYQPVCCAKAVGVEHTKVQCIFQLVNDRKENHFEVHSIKSLWFSTFGVRAEGGNFTIKCAPKKDRERGWGQISAFRMHMIFNPKRDRLGDWRFPGTTGGGGKFNRIYVT